MKNHHSHPLKYLRNDAMVSKMEIVDINVTFRRFVDDFRRWANRFVTVLGSFYDE